MMRCAISISCIGWKVIDYYRIPFVEVSDHLITILEMIEYDHFDLIEFPRANRLFLFQHLNTEKIPGDAFRIPSTSSESSDNVNHKMTHQQHLN